jgi:hypothetical protein
MSEQNSQRLRADGEIKVRLYGQGLGDCFLFAFPRTGEPDRPCYLVIDCGAAMSTPGRDDRTRKVVENIHAATGGRIDALAITHQHFDHISGFQDCWQEWKKIEVDALYLPWTEATAESGEHKSTSSFRKVLDRAAAEAVKRADEKGVLGAQPGLRAQAEFLGVETAETAGAVPLSGPNNMDETMEFIRSLCKDPEKIRYFRPGDVFRLPGTECHGYVLGPPLPTNLIPSGEKKGKPYIELLVDESEGVMYSYHPLGMKLDPGKPGGDNAFALSDDHSLPALASALLADAIADPGYRDGDDAFSPFAPSIRLDWDNAMDSPFFKNHYGSTERGENGNWRRADFDWLGGAANLALRAGDFTNNVSLVLAFDVPGSEKMLLFPGDAQVGNWLSWHTIHNWRFVDGSVPEKAPASNDKQTLMDNLLSRVAFYKVGHHGSHNATIQKDGLEKMTRDDLVAFIPVSIPVAQDLMGYCPMPFYPVLRALQQQTRGRTFLPNGKAVGPHPPGSTDQSLLTAAKIVPSAETFPPIMDGTRTAMEQLHLYLELTVAGP